MNKPFSALDLIQRLRAFRTRPNTEVAYLIRFVREAGAPTASVVEAIHTPEETEYPAELITVIGDEFQDHEDDLAALIVGSIQDAFDMEAIDGEGSELGDVAAEELFLMVLSKGFVLLSESPYFEMQLRITRLEDGYDCNIMLNRTSYNIELNQQINIVLFTASYPLISIDGEEIHQESETQ